MSSEEFIQSVQSNFDAGKKVRAELYEKYPKLDEMLAAQQIATVTSVRTGQDIDEADVFAELADTLKIPEDDFDDIIDMLRSRTFSEDIMRLDEIELQNDRARDFLEEVKNDMEEIEMSIGDMEDDVETALDRMRKKLNDIGVTSSDFKEAHGSENRRDAFKAIASDKADDPDDAEDILTSLEYMADDYDEVIEMRKQIKELNGDLEELQSGPASSRDRAADLLKQGFFKKEPIKSGYDEDKIQEMLGEFRRSKTYKRALDGMTIVRRRKIQKSEPIANSEASRLINGYGPRSVIDIPETGVQVILNPDQRGDIRRRIEGLRSQTGNRNMFTAADQWLSSGKPQVTPDNHAQIIKEFNMFENRDIDLGELKYLKDVIDLAAGSEDGKWESPKKEGSFDGRPKPSDLTKRQRVDLLDWGQNDANEMTRKRFVGMKEDDVSPKGWMMLRNDRGMGLRSETAGSRGGSINETRDTGKRAQRGRPVGAGEDKRFKGKTFAEVKPDNWDSLTVDERYDELLTNLHPSKTGLREVDFNRLRKELVLQSVEADEQTVRAERRRRRREALGNTRVTERAQARAARPAPATQSGPEAAQAERKREVEKLGNRVARISANVDRMFERDEERGVDPGDESHRDVWSSITDIIEDSDELTLSQLESIGSTLDDYLDEASASDELTSTESNSVQNARVLRNDVTNLFDKYRADASISAGDSSAATRMGGDDEDSVATQGREAARFLASGGLRSFSKYKPSDTVQEYAQARRGQGLRSQRAGRTVINEEATFFKAIEDSLAKEIREARNVGDSRTVKGLELLQRIMRRQDSGKVSDRRTNAGSLYVTADEVDEILDAMMFALDRQMETGGSRVDLFARFVEMMSEAAMGTFIDRTTEEVSSRTQRRTNSEGRQVNIANQ